MPELKIDSAPPSAVQRVPVPAGAKVFWTLRAVYPAPYMTVWIRFWEQEHDTYLDVMTASGELLQRVRLDPGPEEKLPVVCQALYLETGRHRGPLLYIKSAGWHHIYAFPDGFSGFLSENSAPTDTTQPLRFTRDARGVTALLIGKERRHWSGVSFVEGASAPDIAEGTAPLHLPLKPTKEETRFAAAFFDRVYFLRWVIRGKTAILEVLDKAGRPIARHSLRDTFGASPRWSSLNAVWLDDRRKQAPVIIVRDSDQVRVHVFSEGLRKLLVAQDFNDSSTSLSATTVSFGRDKKGLLTVTEAYSERGGDDGSGGDSHDTHYRWTGSSFDEIR